MTTIRVSSTERFLRAAWRAYEAAGQLPSVVRPSIPIAWFGDLNAYFSSSRRVITVGLNPSLAEFPASDPLSRFPAARSMTSGLTPEDLALHATALNRYFRERPYWNWFRPSFEEVLLGMGASYAGDRPNTAVHTDLYSPLATNPTWSRLDAGQREALAMGGIDLWHDLVRFLEPDCVIASIGARHQPKIRFERCASSRTLTTITKKKAGEPRRKPLVVEGCDIAVAPSRRTVLVTAPAANTPFGTVSTPDKGRIGAAIKTDLDH